VLPGMGRYPTKYAGMARGGRIRLKTSAGKGSDAGALPQVTLRHIRPHLASLYEYTNGKPFGPMKIRSWIRQKFPRFRVPTVPEAGNLLMLLHEAVDKDGKSTICAYRTQGWRYKDCEGISSVDNLWGHKLHVRYTKKWVTWHEYGLLYSLRTAGSDKAGNKAQVVFDRAYKALGCVTSKQHIQVKADKAQAEFRNVVIHDPLRGNKLSRVQPEWTLIYLHSFSQKGTDYLDFPHYFGIGGAAVRVVLPTAPYQEQTCFEDWWVTPNRRVRFNSWFDYKTDKGGVAENEICVDSLKQMRNKLHGLIRVEAAKLAGGARRILLGGCSQGCCVALDAAMTYPEELGGVIGLVGHVLKDSQLDPAKQNMPLHLFHEASDREMRWKWVKGTVERLRDQGFNVFSEQEKDPSGGGHWIQEIEGQWICRALRRIVATAPALAADPRQAS